MLKVLAEVEDNLSVLLEDEERWNSLDVDYDPPRVERVWTEYGEYRVNLHKIHPCEKALFHPHPWPSAVKVVSGSYEMAVGYEHGYDPLGSFDQHVVPAQVTLIVLAKGSSYEMVDVRDWHYVRPLGGPSMSLMVTGRPWLRESLGKGREFQSLMPDAKKHLLTYFKATYFNGGQP